MCTRAGFQRYCNRLMLGFQVAIKYPSSMYTLTLMIVKVVIFNVKCNEKMFKPGKLQHDYFHCVTLGINHFMTV